MFMNIENKLRRDGIEVIEKLGTLTINSLAKNISEKIYKAFPEESFCPQKLFIKLSRIPMYIAKIPEGMAEANYFYKNSSIYFREGYCQEELEKFAVHEFLHCIQEVKDNKNNLLRLGLYEFGEFKDYGMALNEGAVQLATSKILEQSEDIVKYYDISFPTISPNYYPMLCSLVKQLAYVVGEDILYFSTLFSNDDFKLKAIELLGKKSFFTIQDNLDKLLDAEKKIIVLNQRLTCDNCEGKKAQKISSKIANLKLLIKDIFIDTQNCILTSYFDKAFENLYSSREIEIYRTKLYNFQNYIGITENYNYFNNYYINKMAALEERFEDVFNSKTALAVIKITRFTKLLNAIRSLFTAKKH